MPEDPSRAATSYRHPETGEWAHFLLAGPAEDSWKTYLEPAWEFLNNFSAETLRVVEIGFGRGFQSATLLQRWSALGKRPSVEIHAFEPHPEILEPWPEVPSDLKEWMPWWGMDYRLQHLWEGALAGGTAWSLHLHPVEAQDPHPWTTIGPVHLFLVDLFSPGRHPQQWRQPLVPLMATHAAPASVLTTYTCARQVRECLNQSGWKPVVLKREGWRDTLVAHFLPTAT